MAEAINQAVTGFIVVVLGMFLLTGIIILFSKIMANNNKKDKKKDVQVVEVEKENKVLAEIQIESDEEEIVAAILASVYAYIEQEDLKDTYKISVKPLVRTGWNNTWNQVGFKKARVEKV